MRENEAVACLTMAVAGYSLQAVADNDSVLPCTSEPFDILCHVAFVNVPEVNDIGDDLKVQVLHASEIAQWARECLSPPPKKTSSAPLPHPL